MENNFKIPNTHPTSGNFYLLKQTRTRKTICIKQLSLKIFLCSLIILLNLDILSAEELNNDNAKQNLLIYDFEVTDNSTPETKRKDTTDIRDVQYYSFIIPDTISKNISAEGQYIVSREREIYTIETTFRGLAEKKAYTKRLQKLGKEKKADFIICGTCVITDDSLEIRVTVFNVKGRELLSSGNTTNELGAVIKDSTDFISSRIEEAVTEMSKSNSERFRPSPFLSLYKPFSYMSLGVDGGYMFILGDWSDIYNSALYISPYIMFDITSNLSVSLEYDYFSTDSKNKDVSSESSYRMMGGTIDLTHKLNLTNYFNLYLSYGGGISYTKIVTEPGDPFTIPLSSKSTTDPTAEISTGINIKFSNFIIHTGVLYKRIFYKDKTMNMSAVFGGVAVHF